MHFNTSCKDCIDTRYFFSRPTTKGETLPHFKTITYALLPALMLAACSSPAEDTSQEPDPETMPDMTPDMPRQDMNLLPDAGQPDASEELDMPDASDDASDMAPDLTADMPEEMGEPDPCQILCEQIALFATPQNSGAQYDAASTTLTFTLVEGTPEVTSATLGVSDFTRRSGEGGGGSGEPDFNGGEGFFGSATGVIDQNTLTFDLSDYTQYEDIDIDDLSIQFASCNKIGLVEFEGSIKPAEDSSLSEFTCSAYVPISF